MEERRGFVRVVSELRLRYRVLDEGPPKDSSAHDVCGGGLRLITNEKIDEGRILKFDMEVPGSQRAVAAEARVVWSEDMDGGCWEVGTEFTRIEPRDQAKILKYVYSASKGGAG
ncbi:MAG: PilZ domain-containing protein [bacterium]